MMLSKRGDLLNSGDRIKQLRIQKNLTLEELGKRVGVGKSTVRKWETGAIANMRRDKIAKLADALGTTVMDIMGIDDLPIENVFPFPSFSSVPLLGTIACGEPILAEENLEGEVDLPEHIHADFALRCEGDSMINARIFDGDIVYIRQQPIVEDGQIAAVLIGDEATLKRVHLFPDHVVLEPENPQYRPLVFWENDMNKVRVLGRAVAFTSCVR